MAIKYVVVPERRMVKAMLENCEYDAYNKINKMLGDTPFCVCSDKYLMKNRFVVELYCDERDEFNEEFGKKRAKKILLDNYYKSLDKKIAKFREDALIFNGKVFETPKALENNT
jgi:hypothetical protein